MQKARETVRSTRPEAGRAQPGAKQASQSGWRGHAQSLLVAVLLALFVRQFLLQAFHIPSQSMENTLLVGDFLFVNKFLYGAQLPFSKWRLPGLRAPRRGDIIVFKSYDGRDFIKRCVAVPGDTVEVRAKALYINGRLQNERYVRHVSASVMPPGTSPRDFFGPRVVGRDSIFMMGDNRDNSEDSRFWGPLAVNRVKGKAIFIYFSIDRSYGYVPPHVRFRRMGDIIH